MGVLSPENFGQDYYGVCVSADEDGDYLAYGHVDPMRLAAAINKDARVLGYKDKYFELTYEDVKTHMHYKYLNRVEFFEDSGEWVGKWCSKDDEGAIPVTKVYL